MFNFPTEKKKCVPISNSQASFAQIEGFYLSAVSHNDCSTEKQEPDQGAIQR